ncbi:MAG: thioester reductase domain-containing protein [Chitinophagaceae bacterium]|nr:thioester reductase domain-containing protein [Chitinophagaceae bacterium]
MQQNKQTAVNIADQRVTNPFQLSKSTGKNYSNVKQLVNFIPLPTIKYKKAPTRIQKDTINQNIADGLAEIAEYNPVINTEHLKMYNPNYQSVLVTGANGFLAVHLIQEILNSTEAKIYCCIRAENVENGMWRLKESINKYNIKIEDFSRIIILCSDLTKTNLGLDNNTWNHLCNEVDAIYHLGAYVHHLQTYQRMAPTNVGSTKTIITLATTNKLKRIHFTSSKYANINNVSKKVYEGMPSVCPPHNELAFGYVVTKWVAEWLLYKVSNFGVPVDIYRFGDATGHSQTGVSNYEKNNLTRLILGCLQMKKAPYYSLFLDTVPVDYVAKSICCLSKLNYKNANGWNIINPNHIDYTQYFKILQQLGHQLDLVEYNDWTEHLHQIDGNNLLAPLKNYYSKQSSIGFIDIETTKTEAALKNNAVNIPTDYAQLLSVSFNYWEKVGFYSKSVA